MAVVELTPDKLESYLKAKYGGEGVWQAWEPVIGCVGLAWAALILRICQDFRGVEHLLIAAVAQKAEQIKDERSVEVQVAGLFGAVGQVFVEQNVSTTITTAEAAIRILLSKIQINNIVGEVGGWKAIADGQKVVGLQREGEVTVDEITGAMTDRVLVESGISEDAGIMVTEWRRNRTFNSSETSVSLEVNSGEGMTVFEVVYNGKKYSFEFTAGAIKFMSESDKDEDHYQNIMKKIMDVFGGTPGSLADFCGKVFEEKNLVLLLKGLAKLAAERVRV